MHLSMYCPRYHPAGMGWGLDLYEINCLSPWSQCYRIKCPPWDCTFSPYKLQINYWSNPPDLGYVLVKMRSNPHLLPVGGRWGNTLIGALYLYILNPSGLICGHLELKTHPFPSYTLCKQFLSSLKMSDDLCKVWGCHSSVAGWMWLWIIL